MLPDRLRVAVGAALIYLPSTRMRGQTYSTAEREKERERERKRERKKERERERERERGRKRERVREGKRRDERVREGRVNVRGCIEVGEREKRLWRL